MSVCVCVWMVSNWNAPKTAATSITLKCERMDKLGNLINKHISRTVSPFLRSWMARVRKYTPVWSDHCVTQCEHWQCQRDVVVYVWMRSVFHFWPKVCRLRQGSHVIQLAHCQSNLSHVDKLMCDLFGYPSPRLSCDIISKGRDQYICDWITVAARTYSASPIRLKPQTVTS